MRSPRGSPSCSAFDREEPPLAGHALELGRASLLECKAGPCNEVLDRARHENLSRTRLRGDAGADVNGNPAGTIAGELHLARVQACADVQAEVPDGVGDCARAA